MNYPHRFAILVAHSLLLPAHAFLPGRGHWSFVAASPAWDSGAEVCQPRASMSILPLPATSVSIFIFGIDFIFVS